jgi:hypothetical protein
MNAHTLSSGRKHLAKSNYKVAFTDLEEINDHSHDDLVRLVNSNVVITGASGFIGTWLTLSWASARVNIKAKENYFSRVVLPMLLGNKHS